jgi:hypothetical protein
MGIMGGNYFFKVVIGLYKNGKTLSPFSMNNFSILLSNEHYASVL